MNSCSPVTWLFRMAGAAWNPMTLETGTQSYRLATSKTTRRGSKPA
jgi:hypothetical protein